MFIADDTIGRNYLLRLLERYKPSDTQEQLYKQQIQEFVRAHENCFERSLKSGHITASSWLVNQQGSHALLMHHTKLDNWFQLGGHCDGESNVLKAAIKEAQEESGISDIVALSDDIFDIDVHLIPKAGREQAHYHYDIRFLLQVKSDELVNKNSESKELRWIGKYCNDLPTKSVSITRMFHKWLLTDCAVN